MNNILCFRSKTSDIEHGQNQQEDEEVLSGGWGRGQQAGHAVQPCSWSAHPEESINYTGFGGKGNLLRTCICL